MERPRHRVSAKIALLNLVGDRVLMTRTHDGGFGLPGGHVEYDELPEDAIIRELKEELGLIYNGPLTKADFWRDARTDRILLGFIGQLDEAVELKLDQREVAGVIWASIEDFDRGSVATMSYEAYVRKVMTINNQKSS